MTCSRLARRRTGWAAAAGILSLVLVASCAAGGATPSAAPARADLSAPPMIATAAAPTTTAASLPPVAGPTPARAGLSTQLATPSAGAGLPIRRVDDVAYLRNLLPASAVGMEPGAEVALDIVAPRSGGPWPVVIWAPGGEMKRSMGWSFGDALAARGAVVFLVDTVHAMTPDVEPLGVASRAMVEVASCAVRTARALAPTYGGDPSRVVWSGASLGGIYGIELALAERDWEQRWDARMASAGEPGPTIDCLTKGGSDRIDALVTAGSVRLVDEYPDLYAADPAVLAFTESVSHVGSDPDVIVRLVHGDSDPDVPFALAQRFERSLAAAGYDVTLTPVALGGHDLFFAQVTDQILGVVGSPGW